MLRSVLLTSALGVCLAGPALAQPASDVNWSGPYVGINLGYGGGSFGYPFSGTTDPAGTNPTHGRFYERSSGIIGGGQAGYSFQMPSGLILGLETDLDGTDINGSNRVSGVDSLGNAGSSGTRSQIDYLGTVRGRVGYPLFGGRLAPYVTGGFAYGQVDTTNTFNCSACGSGGASVANALNASSTRTGWAVGGGADYALTRKLGLRVEYLYANLGQAPVATGAASFGVPGGQIYNASVDARARTNLVRVGLNYHF